MADCPACIWSSIRKAVFQALDYAKENGYTTFLAASTPQVTEDLAEYDADVQKLFHERLKGDLNQLIPFVQAWKNENQDQ